ncbi:hypothetical protein [Saccharopolyspora spinosa]|uniref:hypothetical protein n=1 Tax=Saccharopolyspora spinosa TaxID=60894 RepID=UPI000237B069|nr:hypothetical protein [Saccharopolyspora spinosa]
MPIRRDVDERTKRELAAARRAHVQDYADAKTAVVEEIIAQSGGRAQPRVMSLVSGMR